MMFLPPVFLFLFALVFFSVWLLERERSHLALLGLAFLLISSGVFIQISFIPADHGLNAVMSAIFYVAGALCFAHAILLRSGTHLSYLFHMLFFIAIISSTIYYFYVEQKLLYRIYIINLGMGAIFLTAAFQGRFLLRGKVGDKVLFWLTFGLGLHFFPRTIFTVENMASPSVLEFTVSPFWLILQFTISVAGVAMGLGLLTITFMDIIMELRKERDTDSLTGLANRRLFSEHIQTAMREGAYQKKPMSFAMVDVDYFKLYNDLYGHSAGDVALKKVARAINSSLSRPKDMAARIGGEEFGLLFYDCTIEQAGPVLELVRKRIAALNIRHEQSPFASILTVSIGVAELVENEDFESLFKRADMLLYSSKATGRNQITIA